MICVKYGYNIPVFNFLYADDADIFHLMMQSWFGLWLQYLFLLWSFTIY